MLAHAGLTLIASGTGCSHPRSWTEPSREFSSIGKCLPSIRAVVPAGRNTSTKARTFTTFVEQSTLGAPNGQGALAWYGLRANSQTSEQGKLYFVEDGAQGRVCSKSP